MTLLEKTSLISSFIQDDLIDAETAGEILAEASGGQLTKIQALLTLAQYVLDARRQGDGWMPESEWRRRWG